MPTTAHATVPTLAISPVDFEPVSAPSPGAAPRVVVVPSAAVLLIFTHVDATSSIVSPSAVPAASNTSVVALRAACLLRRDGRLVGVLGGARVHRGLPRYRQW